MPTITLSRDRIEAVLGRKISITELEEALPQVVLDLEDVNENEIKVEYNPNRPDYSSSTGILRVLAGRLGIQKGLQKYQTKKGKHKFIVDDSVENVRPYIVGAVVHGVSLTEANLIELMAMQEDLHWAVGRDRFKAAIGVHDLDRISPPYIYKAVDPTEYRFVPLQETKSMNLKQILKHHPKGQKFAHLVTSKKKYPLIVDVNDEVLSFPPIINGVLTQIKDTTRNFLLDITGPSQKAITAALNIITTSLADDGAIVETVDIEYSDHTETVPDLSPTKANLSIQRTNDLLGLSLAPKQIIESLLRVRLDAKIRNKSTLDVFIPPYRVDILHEVDLIEEVAVGYGIDKLKPQIPEVVTLGNAHPILEYQKTVRDILIGLGYLDVLTFALVNKKDVAVKTLIPKTISPIELQNPVSQEFNMLRTSVIPSLINVLAHNLHADLPIRIFEVGDTIIPSKGGRTETKRQMTLGAATMHSNAGFTETKSLLTTVLQELRVSQDSWKVKPLEQKFFIPGRAAEVYQNEKRIGIIGETHPKILTDHQIEFPVGVLELDLDLLYLQK